jgi:tetratricopeptide (TPR) repeat protein
MTWGTVAGGMLLFAVAACRSEPADPLELMAAHTLGLTHLQRGELPEAEAQFRKVVSLAPRDPIGHANLGLTYLRGERYREAESELRRARRLSESSVEVGLILAKLYSLTERGDEARTTLEKLPRDARVLYALAELEAPRDTADTASLRRYQDRLSEVLREAPANLAVRLQLAHVLSRRGLADSAAQRLEEIGRLRPEPPREARPQLDSTLRMLRQGNIAAARGGGPLDRFLHAMELTAPYQAALEEVKWVQGPLVGRPVLAFNPQSLLQTRAIPGTSDTPLRFTDMTAESGLSALGLPPTAIALGDYDGDGTENLLVATANPGQRAYETRAYNVLGGYVADLTERSGIALPTGAIFATFADFNNDGWLDLFAIGADGRGILLRNDGKGKFDDATATARLPDVGGARTALTTDLDHDGDIDLLLVGGARARVYRNNLDGSFTDATDATGFGNVGSATDAAYADFDDDGRVDVAFAKADGSVGLFLNTGFRSFRDASAASGVRGRASTGSDARVAVADYDNSGTLDLLATGGGGTSLWRNAGNGTFTVDQRSDGVVPRGVRVARFVDHDNDGWLDLILAGARGMSLLRNNGNGRFEDRTSILPQAERSTAAPGAAIGVSDVDDDGDQDLFVSDSTGVRVLRNDGGNARMGMSVQLLGLRTGGGKNNTFGFGSKLELRSGQIYQTRVVTSRVTHFGLGPHLKADVLRVQWTNGVPETIYFPGTDADVLELEQLKGSCAFLYTWDGKGFRFVTDVMWQSALGMPVGLMGGGSAAYAPAGASQEYLRIPGDALQPRNGRYVIQLTEELWETAYVDEVQLIAVDHPDSVEVYVDERFPPRARTLRTFNAVQRRPIVSAADGEGNDLLVALREKDDVYAATLVPLQYQGLARPHELILDLGEGAGRDRTSLYLRGWIYPTDASINVALAQQKTLAASMPSLEVRNARGEWETAIPSIGFPSGKDKTVVIDLAGLFPTADHRVRIRTNMQIFWDQAFVAEEAESSPVRRTAMRPVAADLHFRGYSKMYRKGGRHGPHWFAYDSVSRDAPPPWRTIEGAFTRFGGVRPLLQSSDDMYVIMAPGDEMTVEFDASAVGAVQPGWRRTYLLYSDGWIKDADLNTAHGQSVEPLPFHAIKTYPYAPGESYPTDSAHSRYRREYNTRVVRRNPRAQTAAPHE